MSELVWPELYFIRHGETNWNAEGFKPAMPSSCQGFSLFSPA